MCGIFGIINTYPKKLDYQTFCTLGINNDSRGGDSCGIMIDGQVEYGVDKQKLFENFFLNSTLINSTDKAEIAIGHCRKASVGAINKENAQPIVIYDENDNTKINYVLIHNGTICNYKELANKYIPEINISGMTDSKVMALIFYYRGYDVLEEYIGAGAFVMVDYRTDKPSIKFFKGESKYSKYSNDVTEERPFYFVQTKTSFYFSSISTFLYTIPTDNDIFTLRANNLVEIKNNELEILKEYNRTDKYQKDTSVYYNNYYNNDYYDNYYNKYESESKNGTLFKDNDQSNISKYNTYSKDIYVKPDFKGNYYYEKSNNKILCHGKRTINPWGRIIKPDCKYDFSYEFWFFMGVLLYNKECFSLIENIKKHLGYESNADFMRDFSLIVRFLSPDAHLLNDKYVYTADYAYGEVNVEFSGEIEFLFSNMSKMIIDGKEVSSYQTTGLKSNKTTIQEERFNDYVKILKENTVNLNDLKKYYEGI